jgi:mannose-6-phosphate isomerase-like protein (cupin superfamily)
MLKHVTAPGRTSWRQTAQKTSGRFEGRECDGMVSAFVVDAAPGEGPGAHWHPYVETFVVLAGAAVFTVDGTEFPAAAGDVLTVPARTPHGFTATAPHGVALIGIHASPEIIQTNL